MISKKFFILEQAASLWLPILLVVVYLVASFLLKDILPSTSEIVSGLGRYFAKYGYQIVFVGAFLEGALLIDFLVPGASVVLAGAYFSSLGVLSYPVFLMVSFIGFSSGFFLDYLVGFYGWSDILTKLGLGSQVRKAQEKIKKIGGKAFFLGYIHPDLATIFAVAAGIAKLDIKQFLVYNFLAGAFWLIFWTGLVYIFGPEVQKIFEDHTLLVILFVPVLLGIGKAAKLI